MKLTIWGQLVYRFWDKMGDYCHSLRAVYYRQSPIAIGYHNRLVDKEMKVTGTDNCVLHVLYDLMYSTTCTCVMYYSSNCCINYCDFFHSSGKFVS